MFNFRGRINRLQYFLYILALNAVGYFAQKSDNLLVVIPLLLAGLLLISVGICVMIRRFHDLDRPGTHLWLLLIPIYNLYLGLVLLLKKGTAGKNRYDVDTFEKSIVND